MRELSMFRSDHPNTKNFRPKEFWSLGWTFSLIILEKKYVIVFVCLDVIQTLGMLLELASLYFPVSDQQLIFTRPAHFINVSRKLTAFHLSLQYKRKIDFHDWILLSTNLRRSLTFEKLKTLGKRLLFFFTLFSSLAISRVFRSQYPITEIHLISVA